MGNGFAYTVLALWPLIAVMLYRKKSIQAATLWTILGGLLFLPVKTVLDFPLLPPFGKHSIPVLSALFGCWFVCKERIRFWDQDLWIRIIILSIILSPFITVYNNREPILVGQNLMNGLTYHDALSSVIESFLYVAPFFIGRQLFRTREHQILMLKVLVFGGLMYSLFIWFEVRMSPQLHTWFYGYFPHSFAQQKRFEGFRAVVFIGHGLEVAYFIAITVISSAILWKNKDYLKRKLPGTTTLYLLLVLFFCKSVASFVYGTFSVLLIRFFKAGLQLKAALVIAIMVLLYPNLSILNMFPHDTVLEYAESFDAERASSLEYRFDNEEILLERAREKFLFGWGGWGRNRVYNEITGSDLSVTDGTWIVVLGKQGWIGFFTLFGLMFSGVFFANRAASKNISEQDKTLISAQALLVSIIMLDQLPNSSLEPWLFLIIGALVGRSEELLKSSENK